MTPSNRFNRRPQIGSGSLRRLGEPGPVRVSVGTDGRPVKVEGKEVMSIRESWLVEDRWWTANPIQRHYWEIVDEGGTVKTVFREPGDHWLTHR
ncbi:MAG: hypothetical protein NTX07_04050 [Solirubrobacterales bacterium]|nr:hypothetical protein [Solirubrobacterales bacterium]